MASEQVKDAGSFFILIAPWFSLFPGCPTTLRLTARDALLSGVAQCCSMLLISIDLWALVMAIAPA
jgi:hypothetical protein